jgi:hypothetical protein
MVFLVAKTEFLEVSYSNKLFVETIIGYCDSLFTHSLTYLGNEKPLIKMSGFFA